MDKACCSGLAPHLHVACCSRDLLLTWPAARVACCSRGLLLTWPAAHVACCSRGLQRRSCPTPHVALHSMLCALQVLAAATPASQMRMHAHMMSQNGIATWVPSKMKTTKPSTTATAVTKLGLLLLPPVHSAA